jgi:hypothetical protein
MIILNLLKRHCVVSEEPLSFHPATPRILGWSRPGADD